MPPDERNCFAAGISLRLISLKLKMIVDARVRLSSWRNPISMPETSPLRLVAVAGHAVRAQACLAEPPASRRLQPRAAHPGTPATRLVPRTPIQNCATPMLIPAPEKVLVFRGFPVPVAGSSPGGCRYRME